MIKFGIPIALLKEFGSEKCVSFIEVSNMRKCSGKANKLRYIYTIRGTSRDIAIKEWKINNIKKTTKKNHLSYTFVETVLL